VRCRRDWPAEVAVDELEGVASAVARLLGERQPPLLPGKAAVAQLAGMLDQWQPGLTISAKFRRNFAEIFRFR